MPDLDALAPNYRRAQRRWPDAPTLAKCYEALNACFDGNGHGMVEYVKSYIECVCLTIMGELREPIPSSTPSTTDLLIAALNPLGLRNSRGASKLDRVLSGFNRLADALSEMRNATGPVAHGRDAFLDALSADHTRAFLHVGDAILGVLLNALEGKQPDLTVTREPYESFPHLNERIDCAVTVEARVDEDGERPIVVFSVATGPRDQAIELRVEPSRLLYSIDRSAYIEVLQTADLVVADGEEAEEEEEPMAAPRPASASGMGAEPLLAPPMGLVQTYEGPLDGLRVALADMLIAEGLEAKRAGERGARLIDSLLATAEQNMGLDWKRRESFQAALKVACKRVLIRFGCAPGRAEKVAERLMTWLRVEAPEVEVDRSRTSVVAGEARL